MTATTMSAEVGLDASDVVRAETLLRRLATVLTVLAELRD